METQIVTSENLTFLGALITAVGSLWAYILKLQSDHRTIVREKDEKLERLTNKFIDVTEKTTQATSEVKSAVENNTQAMRDNSTLTQKVYDALIERNI